MRIEDKQQGQWLRMAVAGSLVMGVALALVVTPLGRQLWSLMWDPSAARLAQTLPATAVWLAVALIGLMVLHTLVPVPAEFLALAAGMALGPLWGFLTIWLGAMLGAWLGFYLARVLGQPFLRYVIASERLEHWLGRLRDADASLLLAVRLLPIISFNLINYALGLSPIRWWRFTWTTGIGIVPVTVFMVVFGAHPSDWRMLVFMTVAGILVGIGGYLFLRCRGSALLSWGISRRP